MNRLQKMAKNSYSKPKQKNKDWTVPEFDANGKVIKLGNQARQRKIVLIGVIVLWVYIILYIPGIFMGKKNKETNSFSKTPDTSTIKVFKDYVDKSKTQDFDGDNLDNATENSYGINPWDIDSDADGVSDYYEIYITKTSPSEYDKDLLEEMQKKEDKEKGVTLDTPYKCGNVILWANDYTSKARGGVVETPLGYHFSNFDGYAQFPHEQTIYAYTNDSGEYKKLKYLKDSDAWEIKNVHNVVIFTSPLKEITKYSFFKATFYFPHNFFGSLMELLLPEKGWLTAKKTTMEDVEPTTLHKVTTDNYNITYDVNNGERFKQKTNSLKDLQFVRTMIDNNKSVEVSLYNSKDGEIRGIIYGYDEENNLYVADDETLQPLGVIKVDEIGEKAVSYNGDYGLITYFNWYGLGYNSSRHDNISFFAVADDPSNLFVTEEAKEQEEPVLPTPTDASETDATATDADAQVYDPDTDENYVIPVLYTGKWNHSGEGFINILSEYTGYTDNTEEMKQNELYSSYLEDSTIQAFASYKDQQSNILYLWVAEHLKAKGIYDYLTNNYMTDDSVVEETNNDLYKEKKITNGDNIYLIRRYSDDTFIIITSEKGLTEDIQSIIDDIGNTETEPDAESETE